MRSIAILLLLSSITVVYTGRGCTHTLQCGRGYFCSDLVCRKDTCARDSECDVGENCRPGNVNGRMKSGCFQTMPKSIATTDDYCPGGAIVMSMGSLTTCDLSNQCPSTHVCNPIHGICCTKLPTCPKTHKTMLNFVTKKPIICQFKQGRVMPCPQDGLCEESTGFCCVNNGQDIHEVEFPLVTAPPLVKERPWRGQVCSPQEGCSGGAACICGARGNCMCECATDFGYTLSNDGRTCQRVRRRLKEKCKTDMECSAAFSECSSGGCRCKRGFKRNGDGGCEPIEYRCVNKAAPLKNNEKLVTCSLKNTVLSKFRSLKRNSTSNGNDTITDEEFENLMKGIETVKLNENDRDSCPEEHYCVPVFDDATKPGYYQGFCCPSPSDIRPTCPVGEPHDSSYPPDYGCAKCPIDYYCHRDSVATDKTICCPKPCVSLEDIYHEGQCYSMAYYGDSCHISSQCVYSKSPDAAEEYAELSKMECTRGICSCPSGFSYADGQCKRIMCSIGLRGEPSIDKNGQLIRCERSADCSMGHMCDPNTHVCCKGTNRCPKDYVETGELCTDDNCRGLNEMCHRTKNGKAKICCTYDDVAMFSMRDNNSTIN